MSINEAIHYFSIELCEILTRNLFELDKVWDFEVNKIIIKVLFKLLFKTDMVLG